MHAERHWQQVHQARHRSQGSRATRAQQVSHSVRSSFLRKFTTIPLKHTKHACLDGRTQAGEYLFSTEKLVQKPAWFLLTRSLICGPTRREGGETETEGGEASEMARKKQKEEEKPKKQEEGEAEAESRGGGEAESGSRGQAGARQRTQGELDDSPAQF